MAAVNVFRRACGQLEGSGLAATCCAAAVAAAGTPRPIQPSDQVCYFVRLAMAALACATPRWSPFAAGPARGAQQQPRRQACRLRVRAQGQQGSDEGGPPPEQPPAATPPPPPPPLSDPAALVVYGGRLPPARRLVVSGLTATAIGGQNGLCRRPCKHAAPASCIHKRSARCLPNLPAPCSLPLPAALGGNLFGVTSWLLSLDGGKLAEASRLDVLVPVGGFRRCLDAQNGERLLACARPHSAAAPCSALRRLGAPQPSRPVPLC